MLTESAYTTLLLIIVSFASKLFYQSEFTDQTKCYELIRLSLHWREVCLQDTDAILRLQHASMAVAFLRAARMMCSDSELERACGIDVSRLSRKLDSISEDSRNLLSTKRK